MLYVKDLLLLVLFFSAIWYCSKKVEEVILAESVSIRHAPAIVALLAISVSVVFYVLAVLADPATR